MLSTKEKKNELLKSISDKISKTFMWTSHPIQAEADSTQKLITTMWDRDKHLNKATKKDSEIETKRKEMLRSVIYGI